MGSPGAYRPDPTEGMTAIADVPPPEIIPSHRTDKRQACPRCHHPAYRDKQSQRREQGDAGGYAAEGIFSLSMSMSGYQRLKMALHN